MNRRICGTDSESEPSADTGEGADTTSGADTNSGTDAGSAGDAGAPPLAVFMTEPVASGGGVAGFDAHCNDDEARPDPSAAYASLVLAPERRACSTPLCEGGADPLDWPLAPNRTYAADGAAVFTTNADAIVTEVPAGLIPPEGYNFWSGAAADWTLLEDLHCDGWTATSEGEGALGWTGGPPREDFFGGHGQWGCDTATRVVCVELP